MMYIEIYFLSTYFDQDYTNKLLFSMHDKLVIIIWTGQWEADFSSLWSFYLSLSYYFGIDLAQWTNIFKNLFVAQQWKEFNWKFHQISYGILYFPLIMSFEL